MKILVVQTGFLGDVILSTPLLPALRDIYPEAHLWMLLTPAASGLMRREPLLEGIIEIDKRSKDAGIFGLFQTAKMLKEMGFAKVYALHRSFRTTLLLRFAHIPERIGFQDASFSFLYQKKMQRPKGTHDVLRRLSILGDEKLSHDFSPALRLFAPARDECSESLKSRIPEAGGRYAVLVPGSEWETKRWSWEGYREVAKALIGRNMKVFVCGSSKERAYNKQISENLDVIDLSGQTTLQDLMYLIKNAALVVCNDSMALHMASAFKTPNVAIFCATSPEFGFGPWMNSASAVVQKEGLSCKPCRRHGGHICPTGTEKCMKDLPASNVIRAIDNILSI